MKEETFENSLEKLEIIASELERGNLSLEDAISKFEMGIKLSKECCQKLDKAEKKINILVQTDNGLEEEKFTTEE